MPVIAERLTQGNQQINALVFGDLNRIRYNTKSKLRSFKKLVLIIHGEQDIIGTYVPKAAHSIFPNSKLVLIENSGHYGWLDQPDIYLKEVFDYLRLVQQ